MKGWLNKYQDGGKHSVDLHLPVYEKSKPSLNPYAFYIHPEQNVHVAGIGAHAQGDINDRLNLSGGLHSTSVAYPGGEKIFMKPQYHVGVNYKFKKGGWLDNYGGEINANEGHSSAPDNWEGEGYSNVGRDYSPAWGGQFQKGGKLTAEQLDSLNKAKMKAKMALASEFGNPAARRMMNPTPPSYRFSGNEMIDGQNVVGFGENQVQLPATGTHYMGSMGEYAVPYIQQNTSGNLQFNPNASPDDREAMRFDNPQDAEYFAEHYKDVAPMMRNFAMGGSIPGSVGFTYARTGSTPSNGKYAKKTLPSAQNGLHKKYFPEKVDNWVEPKYGIADNTHHKGYDALSQTIYYDPNSEWENINNPSWLEHERYHQFQNLSGRSHTGDAANRPVEGSTNEEIGKYYNRRNVDLDNQVADMIKKDPSLQFIPKEKLISGSSTILPDGRKSFYGAEDLIYLNPNTEEGEARLYEDYITNGGKSIFPKQENGGMTYYQHGLDWKPKSMQTGGWLDKYTPQAQDGKFVLPDPRDLQRQMINASESTAPTSKQTTTGVSKENMASSTKDMGKVKLREREEEKARVKERQSAKAIKEGKAKTFTFPTGESKSLDQMDAREKAYVTGKSIEGKGRFFENEESIIDDLNPLTWITSAAGALGEAPYEARESDSNLPYAGAIGNALFQGALGFDPLGGAIKIAKNPITKDIIKGAGNAAKTLIDLPRAENIKEAVGRISGIPLKKDIPRMGAPDVKALRQVQEIGRLRATNSPYAEQMKYGLENNLPEEHFQKVFGKSRKEAQQLLDTGFGEQEAARSAGMRSRIDLTRPPGSGTPNTELARLRAQYTSPESARELFSSQGQDLDNFVRSSSSDEIADFARRNNITEDSIYDAYLLDSNLERPSSRFEPTEMTPEEIALSNRGADLDIADISSQELTRGQRNLMNELFGDTNVTGIAEEDISSALENIERQSQRDAMRARFRELDQAEAEAAYVSGNYGPDYESVTPITNRSERVQDLVEGFNPTQYIRNFQDEGINLNRGRARVPRSETLSQELKRNINDQANKLDDRLGNLLGKNIQNYPYYSGEVLEKVPSLSLSGSGNLKNVSKKVSFAPEGIQSGDVFTGSTNTSHSSYLPQLKQVFKYTKGDPQFLGYKPMNSMGFLSQYDYKGGDIAKYLNSEIDEQIKRGIIPKNIQRPYSRGELIMLPHYGVKQHRQGGVIEDNMGQWAHPGKITKINSNKITMKGVDYPVFGVSDEGDTQMMYPEQEYTFKGKTVTEYPQKKNGGWLEKYN